MFGYPGFRLAGVRVAGCGVAATRPGARLGCLLAIAEAQRFEGTAGDAGFTRVRARLDVLGPWRAFLVPPVPVGAGRTVSRVIGTVSKGGVHIRHGLRLWPRTRRGGRARGSRG